MLGCPNLVATSRSYRIKMGKDSEPLRSGKGRALNVKVAQTCLALHVSHQFTHFAATDGGKDHEDKMAEDGKYVPNPRVAYCMVQMLSMQTACCMLHVSTLVGANSFADQPGTATH